MSVTASELALLFIALAGLFHWLGILPKIRALLALLGAITIGASGHLGALMGTVFGWISATFGAITAWAFGVAFTGILLVLGLVIVLHDLHPKKAAGKRTGVLALLVGLAIAAGVSSLPVLAGLSGGVVSVMNGLASALSSL